MSAMEYMFGRRRAVPAIVEGRRERAERRKDGAEAEKSRGTRPEGGAEAAGG